MKFNFPFGWQLWLFKHRGQAFHAKDLFQTNLTIKHYRNGTLIKERNLGSGVVTLAGVNLLAADWTNTTATLKLINYHDSGTGSAPPTINDTTLQIPTGGVRVAGGQSNTFNVYQSVSNLSYTSGQTITEWGIWTASSGGVLWDRRTFAGQGVINGDVLQFIYQLTALAGG